MDANKYDRKIEVVELTDAQELVFKVIMQEGALRYQDAAIRTLNNAGMYDAVKILEDVEVDFTK